MVVSSRSGINVRLLLLIFVIFDAVAVGIVLFLWMRGDFGSSSVRPLLQRAEAGLAYLENEKFNQAIETWESLAREFPGPGNSAEAKSIARNLALARYGLLRKQGEALGGASNLTDAQREEIRQQIPATIKAAIEAVDQALKLEGDRPEAHRIAVLVRIEKARHLEYPIDAEVKKEGAEIAIAALKKFPGDSPLAMYLSDLSEELSGDHPQFEAIAANELFTASERFPRNLSLLNKAGLRLVGQKDPRAIELARRALALITPRLNLEADGNSKSVQEDKEFINKATNGELSSLRPVFNKLLAFPAHEPDRRLAEPNALSMISLDAIDFWRAQVAENEPIPPTTFQPPQKQTLPSIIGEMNAPVRKAVWYDFDLDLTPEIATLQGEKLIIWKQPISNKASGNQAASDPSTSDWEMIAQFNVGAEATDLMPIDLFSVVAGDQPKMSANLMKNIAEKEAGGNEAAAAGVADRRHDTYQDLILWGGESIRVITTTAVERDSPQRQLTEPKVKTGLEAIAGTSRLEPIDWDADGDLDLALIVKGRIELWQNNGNRTFIPIHALTQLTEDSLPLTSLIACDYDRDLDIDLLVGCSDSSIVGLLENLLHSEFRYKKLDDSWKAIAGANDLAVAELDGNASWDWCSASSKGTGALFTRTPAVGEVYAGKSQLQSTQANQAITSLIGCAVADLNNDSWNDYIGWGESGLIIHAGKAGGEFAFATSALATGKVSNVSVADGDRDGFLDLLAVIDGKLEIFRGTGAPGAGYLAARIKGIDDNNGGGRINQYAVGSVLEVHAGSRYMAQVVRYPVTHFGLGSLGKPESLRTVFSNGLTQSLLEPSVNSLIEEKQAPKGSCPFLYGWDGSKYVMITDLLWNAPLGLQIARGKVLPDRRWEHLLLPGELVQPKDGFYELRVTEELWETAYFDQMQLVAIDHPADVDVFTNEKVGPPDLAAPQLHVASKKYYPVSARDSQGKEWTSELSKRDSVYAQPFDRLFCQGLTNPHYLELDLGDLRGATSIKLMLTGWIFPTDTSLNIGLEQHPELAFPSPPALWVPNEQGEFVVAQPFMGFPGGKPKTIVIDLSNAFLTNDYRVRIATSAQIYWDEAFVTRDEPPVPFTEQTLELAEARLHYRGFSRLKDRAADQPHMYDYNQLDRNPNWPIMQGKFTRYGDVKDLLATDDDRIIVMGSGDEMIVRFTPPAKELPAGWKRDFVLTSIGWDKDADLNTLEGQSSLPLPFKGMKQYPPAPAQGDEAEQVWEKNRSQLTREQSFRQFWSPQTSSRVDF